jgi:hypothetical protein
MKHLETLHATSETQPQDSATASMPPSCRNVETSRSTFATSARNTCNILMKHLKHVEHTLATCTNPAACYECLLVAATACPLPRAIPYCSVPREPRAAASSVRGHRRRKMRATRPTVPPPGERPEVGAELTPRSLVLAGGGVAPPRYPDEGATQRRGR